MLSSPCVVGAGIALAVAALFVRYLAREAERQYPPEGRFIDVDGVRLHYIEKGTGEPLVLLHGNTTMGMDFTLSGLVDIAAKHYRVIVCDRPGYGYSERPRGTIWDAEAQARLLHGALVAVALALDFPEAVRSLVLASGSYCPTLRPDMPNASPPAIPVAGAVLRYTVSPLMLRLTWPLMLEGEFNPAPVAESMKKLPAWMMLRASQIRASAAEFALLIPDVMKLSKRYQDLELPIVLIAGSEDRLVYRSRHSDLFHAQVPHSEYLVVEGTGHMVHHIAPGQVLEAIHAAADAADAREAQAETRAAIRRAQEQMPLH